MRGSVLIVLGWGWLSRSTAATGDFTCGMWLAPSLIDGKGVFAGRRFSADDDLDYAPGVPVPFAQLAGTMLTNYVHGGPIEYLAGHKIEYSLVNFGITMIMNHHSPPTRTYAFHEEDSDLPINETLSHPYTTYPVSWHGTEIDLAPGDEIFNLYSYDGSWFADKDLPVWDDVNITTTSTTTQQQALTIDRIEETGHCMTQVYFNVSDILRAGLGLFASRDFKKGEDVTVSPVLILPRTAVEEMYYTSILQNYCIATEESEVVLLPISSSIIANHALNPNMEMDWFQWKSDLAGKLNATLAKNISTLVASKFTELDIVFRATRDILMGEELTFDYGEGWVTSYSTYLAEYAIWLTSHHEAAAEEENEGVGTNEASVPLFRHFIAPPAGMFPQSWNFEYED